MNLVQLDSIFHKISNSTHHARLIIVVRRRVFMQFETFLPNGNKPWDKTTGFVLHLSSYLIHNIFCLCFNDVWTPHLEPRSWSFTCFMRRSRDKEVLSSKSCIEYMFEFVFPCRFQIWPPFFVLTKVKFWQFWPNSSRFRYSDRGLNRLTWSTTGHYLDVRIQLALLFRFLKLFQ